MHCGAAAAAVFLLVAETTAAAEAFIFLSSARPRQYFFHWSVSYLNVSDLPTNVLLLRTCRLLPPQKADRCVSCLQDHRRIVLFPAHNLSSSNSFDEEPLCNRRLNYSHDLLPKPRTLKSGLAVSLPCGGRYYLVDLDLHENTNLCSLRACSL